MRNYVLRAFIVSLCFAFSMNTAFATDTKNLQVKKQPEIQQVKPKKPVKIRLKRSSEGKYTWDLAGDDADEVIRTDKRLKKLLNIE
jgi:hypothetical protein